MPQRESQNRLRLGSALTQCAKLVQMWFRPRQIQSVWFSPDGKHMLITEWLGKAQIFDVQTGRPVTQQFGQRSGLRQGLVQP